MELKVIAAEHIVATGNKDGRWTNVYVTPLADAQATVEALQRERNEAQALVSERASMIGSLTAALDAEREKVAAHERAYQEGHPSPCTLGSLCPYCEIERRVEQLSQLQALVRALCNSGSRLLDDVIGTSDAADSLKHSIKQARATLDATTPATGEA